MDHIELNEDIKREIANQTERFGEQLEEIVRKLKQHYIRLRERKQQLEEILRELEKMENDTQPDVSFNLD